MDLQLKGRKAIVTGATRGIGLAIARTLAGEGVDLAICARTPGDVARTVTELAGRGVRALGDAVDVAQGDEYARWLTSAADRLGGLDIFVHNVTGTPTIAGPKGWDAGYQTDILGAVRGVTTLTPHLRRSGGGAIIFIASISGLISKVIPAPGAHAYGASKAALIAYGSMVSKELAKDRIRVNMVSPGPVYFQGGPWDFIQQRAPQVYAAALSECVIGRLGDPQDIADTVAFLASPRSGFTVGQNLHVDGGYMHHVPF